VSNLYLFLILIAFYCKNKLKTIINRIRIGIEFKEEENLHMSKVSLLQSIWMEMHIQNHINRYKCKYKNVNVNLNNYYPGWIGKYNRPVWDELDISFTHVYSNNYSKRLSAEWVDLSILSCILLFYGMQARIYQNLYSILQIALLLIEHWILPFLLLPWQNKSIFCHTSTMLDINFNIIEHKTVLSIVTNLIGTHSSI
jgi:hypothetical protein